MTDRELMQMALDALEAALSDDQPYISRSEEAIEALRTRISQCERCGEVNPAEIHTCTPQEPVGWIYEDDEGRMMFSQMPQNPPFWEPVYRAKLKEKNG